MHCLKLKLKLHALLEIEIEITICAKSEVDNDREQNTREIRPHARALCSWRSHSLLADLLLLIDA
jgi:hypothetical protein